MGKRTKGPSISRSSVPNDAAARDEIPSHFSSDQTNKQVIQTEEHYRALFVHSSEGIWRFELEQPLPVNLPLDDQID